MKNLDELARRLGQQAADRLDVEATARQVLARLRAGEQPAQSPAWISPAWLRIAAALVIVVGGAVVLREVRPVSRSGNHAGHYIADDLGELSTDQLRDVLSRFDDMVSNSTATDATADLHELDAQQLRQMLRSLEG